MSDGAVFTEQDLVDARIASALFPGVKRIIEYLSEPAYCYFDMREDELGQEGMEAIDQIEKCWSGE